AKSLKYLNEIKPYPKSDLFQQVWTVNYAESLFLQGHIAEAQKMAMELLEKTREQKTGVCHLCVMELLSKIHVAKNEIDKAIGYTKEGLRYDKELSDRIKLFEDLSHLYGRKGEFLLALNYKDSVIDTKDS